MENKDMENIVGSFKNGKIGIFPTDTAFGIGCRIDDENAVKRLFNIRKRPTGKPLLALVSSIEMAEKYVLISERVRKELIDKYWPGGLTLILPCKKEKVPGIVRANGETLALRFPDHYLLTKIIEEVGVPIVAPSANFSDMLTPFEISEVDPDLISKVDFIMAGVCTIRGISTIVDCTVMPWKIVRQGTVRIRV